MTVCACASDSCLSAPSSRACSAARMAIARRSVSDHRSVRNVLARGAEMHEISALWIARSHPRGECRHETDGHRPCAACRARDLGGVQAIDGRARNRLRPRRAGISPTAASARASAISKSSIAWSSERSENTSASSVVVARLSIKWDDMCSSRSEIEEDGFAVALKTNVEQPCPRSGLARQERVPARLRHLRPERRRTR